MNKTIIARNGQSFDIEICPSDNPDIESDYVLIRQSDKRRFRLFKNQKDPKLLFPIAEVKPFSNGGMPKFWVRLTNDELKPI